MGSLTSSPQAFTPQLAAWLKVMGKQGGDKEEMAGGDGEVLKLGSFCSTLFSGSSTHLSLQQGLHTSPFMVVRLEAYLAVWERPSQDIPSHAYFYGCSRCLNKGRLQ